MKNYITYRMYNSNSKIFEIRGFGSWTPNEVTLSNEKTEMKITMDEKNLKLMFDDQPSNYFSTLNFDLLNNKGFFQATLNDGDLDVDIDVKDIDIDSESILLKFLLGEEENSILISRSKHYDN